MISFQRILGREEEFFGLLEASAQEARNAVGSLKKFFDNPSAAHLMHEFADARAKDKEVTEKITEMLITTFVTPMEREDIEQLAEALYKIPKTVEKFAERYYLVSDQIRDINFKPQVALMEQAVQLVLEMVQALREARDLAGIKPLQAKLQQIESDADDLLLQMMAPFYQPGFPALKAVILKDLYDLNEKAVDRCRDAGNVISHIILKNS